VPESILRILDYVAPSVLMIVAMAIPAFAIVAIPFAVQKCSLAPKRASRPFRLRARIWQLMAAVLVVGTALELVIMTRRAYHAYNKTEEHAREASSCRRMLGREKIDALFFKIDSPSLDGPPGLVEYFRSLESYHEGLRQKYRDIARHPWRSVSPDPPEPKMPEGPAIMGPEVVALVREMEILARSVDVMDSQ
jgi:hypothetical protein